MYVDYEYYKNLYGSDAASEIEFNRLSWDACKKMDYYTTGVDGVKKLQVAFPVEDYSVEAVKRCTCSLIELLKKIEQAESNMQSASGYIQREDGSYQGKVVSSVSAGNESISYSAGSSNNKTLFEKALTDEKVKTMLFRDMIVEYLSGTVDANGVNLLYMGIYPYVR